LRNQSHIIAELSN